MILKRLVEFAEQQDTSLPTGYQPRFVTKEIALDLNGGLRNVVPLAGETRGKREGRTRPEPQESPMRTVAVKPRLFADNVNYLLGKAREKDKPDKVAERHRAWVALVEDVAEALPDLQAARAVLHWVRGGGPDLLRDDPRIEEGDELTISVDGDYITDLVAVKRFWAARASEGPMALCLVTGEVAHVVDRMPAPIKGVPDGQMSGTALVSVNNQAGESYGLSAALNSPISADAAEKVCNGLNVLLNEQAGLDARGRRKYKYSLRVGKAVYVAWCRNASDRNLLDDLDDPDPAHVQSYIELARRGGIGGEPAESDFCVLSLSANAARIVVRDYHETTLTNVKRSLGRWFQRLQLVGIDGELAKPMGIYRLGSSLYRDAKKEMPAHVPTDLLRAALKGRPIPAYILGLAVKRNLATQGPNYRVNDKPYPSMGRLALIKAVLTLEPEDTTLSQLNTQNPNPAYHCGRMLAVLEAIQRVAIPGLNATLTDRHYGAACASPASVFGNLLKDATAAHLPKLRKNRPGAYYALDLRLQEIASAVGAEFPRTLTLQDQALFALGYYHQKAHDVGEAKKNKELRELAEAAATESEENAE